MDYKRVCFVLFMFKLSGSFHTCTYSSKVDAKMFYGKKLS